jgi:hypothetical protein
MVYHQTGTRCAEEGEPSTASGSHLIEPLTPASLLQNPRCEMGLSYLVAHCLRELDTYRQGEPGTDAYSLELLRRASIQSDQDARACVRYCFGGLVRGWLYRHPQREMACRLECEEYFVAQAFECFWQATVLNQRVEFSTFDGALQYLRASLNGVILDRLRVSRRTGATSNSWPDGEECPERSVIWARLQVELTNQRETRLAYLLYHCGLSPAEVVRASPQEWSGDHEVSRLRRSILVRLMQSPVLISKGQEREIQPASTPINARWDRREMATPLSTIEAESPKPVCCL